MKNPQKNFIFNSLKLYGIQLFLYLVPFISFPYLVRVLGVEGFGLLTFSLAIVFLFQIFCDWGFSNYGVRLVAKTTKKKIISRHLVQIITCRFLLLVLFSLLFYLVIDNFDRFREDKLVFYSSFLICVVSVFNLDWFFQGIEKNGGYLICVASTKLLNLLMLFKFVNSEQDIYIVPLLTAGTSLLCYIMGIYLIKIKGYKLSIKFNLIRTLSFYRKSLNLFITKISIEMYRSLIPILIGFFWSISAVGAYSIAEKIISLIQSLQQPLGRALLPYKIKLLKKTGVTSHYKFITSITKYLIVTYITVFFVVFTNATFIISIISGEVISSSVENLKLLTIVVIFGGLNYFYSLMGFVALGKDSELSKILLKIALLSILISPILIYSIELYGGALSVILIEFLLFLTLRSEITKSKLAHF